MRNIFINESKIIKFQRWDVPNVFLSSNYATTFMSKIRTPYNIMNDGIVQHINQIKALLNEIQNDVLVDEEDYKYFEHMEKHLSLLMRKL